MEEDLDILTARLLDELKYSVYPSERSAIRDRYTDTSYLIFKTSEAGHRGSFLSFGSRRSSLVSSYGNTPTFIRRSFSSNGMLEYSVEQSGTTKHKDRPSHILPYVTKEEKEMEDVEEKNMLADVKEEENEDIKDGKFNNNVKMSQSKVKKFSKECESLEHIDSCSNENDGSEYSSKNRKIFLHYDMPPSRRPQIQNNVNSGASEISEDSSLKKTEGIGVNEIDKNIKICDNELIRKKDFGTIDTEILHLPKIPMQSVSKSSNGTEANLTKIASETSSRKNSLMIIEEDELPTLPNSSSCLERTSSINEKKNGTSFPRASANRLSLRELPRRSPTPPKKSPRKSSKKEKYVTISPSDSLPSSSTTPSDYKDNRMFPALESLQQESSATSNQIIVLPSLPSVEPNPKSSKNLDDTPLYIVEEGDQLVKLPRSYSSKAVENLVSDSKVNSNFIVVHSPSTDSNSLGLAPLSTLKNRKLSSSSSASMSSQSHSNNRKNFFSRSVESSTTKTTTLSSIAGTSTTSSSTFYSSKESTNIQLLKYSKSVEEANFVIPPPKGAKNNSYLVTRSQIRSVPFDSSSDSYLNQISNKDFVYTNSTRVCSVM